MTQREATSFSISRSIYKACLATLLLATLNPSCRSASSNPETSDSGATSPEYIFQRIPLGAEVLSPANAGCSLSQQDTDLPTISNREAIAASRITIECTNSSPNDTLLIGALSSVGLSQEQVDLFDQMFAFIRPTGETNWEQIKAADIELKSDNTLEVRVLGQLDFEIAVVVFSSQNEDGMQLSVQITGSQNESLTLTDASAGEIITSGDGVYTFLNSVAIGSSYAITTSTSSTVVYCGDPVTGTATEGQNATLTCSAINYPEVFSLNRTFYVFVRDYGNLSISVPTAKQSQGATYTISPGLPSGLAINASTGEISGTPTATSGSTTYTVTQSRINATSRDWDVDIRVIDGFIVDTTQDEIDSNIGDGTCFASTATSPGKCSLRAAIGEANNVANSGERAIVFTGTHTLTSGAQIEINDHTVVIGDSKTTGILDGNLDAGAANSDRFFHIDSAHTLTLIDLTMQKANPKTLDSAGVYADSGASVYISNVEMRDMRCDDGEDGCAMALSDLGALVVEHSEFTNNQITGASGYEGAAYVVNTNSTFNFVSFKDNTAQAGVGALTIFNGTAAINDCTFEDNTSNLDWGALYVLSGANTTIRRTLFHGNFAQQHGGAIGIRDNTSQVTMEDTIFEENEAGDEGAAVWMDQNTTLNANRITIENNDAYYGAGIYTQGGSTANIDNTVFFGNDATHSGGALEARGNAIMNVKNAAFIDNTAGFHGGALSIRDDTTPTINVYNSYFRNNLGNGGASDHCDEGTGPGTINRTNAAFDTIDTTECPAGTNDLAFADFMLGTYGQIGLIRSWPLLAGSPLVDAGENTNCAAEDILEATRPIDGNEDLAATCDIGPVEYQVP